eukprot:m.32272 g.32272  ORF g.32272 m.32272 type:complete len:106 (+) comp31615_c1_seq1:345-662(+)
MLIYCRKTREVFMEVMDPHYKQFSSFEQQNMTEIHESLRELHQDNEKLHQDNEKLHQDHDKLHQDNEKLHKDMAKLHNDNVELRQQLPKILLGFAVLLCLLISKS